MAIQRKQTLELDAPFDQAFEASLRALIGLGITIKASDPAAGTIDGLWPIGLASWGEKIKVAVTRSDAGRSTVDFSSAVRVGIVDWGKNKRNIAKIEQAIPEALAALPA